MQSPCTVNGSQDEADLIASQYTRRAIALSNDLLHGTLSLDDYHTRMQDMIRLSFLHQAIAGTPDADERQLTQADLTALEAKIGKQFEYLDGFMSDIEAAVAKDGASLDFIPNRASLYAKASEAEYWNQATNVDLPSQPRDGSTQCLSNCQCQWDLNCDDQGNVHATWVLGDAGHCPDCEQRAQDWADLVIPTKER